MNNADPELYPVDYDNMISDVWLYVNPLTGKHAKTTTNGRLAVFVNEKIGRSYETVSAALSGMIGYTASWDEMIDIANKQTGGSYELFTNHCN
jgi:hypothetical protein